MFRILKDKQRYEDTGNELPDEILCNGTLEQAREVAFRLSNWYAGCDFLFYVEGDENV